MNAVQDYIELWESKGWVYRLYNMDGKRGNYVTLGVAPGYMSFHKEINVEEASVIEACRQANRMAHQLVMEWEDQGIEKAEELLTSWGQK